MGIHDALRGQFDRLEKNLSQERRDGVARTMASVKAYAALKEAANRSKDRLQQVNVDLRDANVAQRTELQDLKGLVGLRNGDVATLEREVLDQRVRYADTHRKNGHLVRELASARTHLSARLAQFDEQRARLSNAGIMLDDLREQMSKERAQVAINRVSSEKSHGEDMYRAGLRYNALKFDLREIGRLSSNASDGDVWADLMKINAIAQKG